LSIQKYSYFLDTMSFGRYAEPSLRNAPEKSINRQGGKPVTLRRGRG
jgi:hypothetical protein